MALRNRTATLKRLDDAQEWSEGFPVTVASETESTIICSIQPLGGNEMMMIPEARRERESYRIYTDVELRTITDRNPDKLEFDGKAYEVLSVDVWQNAIINHYKAIVQRIDQ